MKLSLKGQEIPDEASIANGLTNEELLAEEERVLAELRAKPEEELTIYDETMMTPEELDELPECALMRAKENGFIYLKVLDLWMPYSEVTLKQPPEPLTKYGRMRLKHLQDWKVNTVFALEENLLIHCWEIQTAAKQMKERLMSEMQERNPFPNRNENPLGWAGYMENLDAQADSTVMREIVLA